ncbi:TPA: hypothetical protein ACHP08_004103 [Providencia stuartii]
MYAVLIVSAFLGAIPIGEARVGTYNDLETCQLNKNEMQLAATPEIKLEAYCREFTPREAASFMPGAPEVNAISLGSWGMFEGRKIPYGELHLWSRDEQNMCAPALKDLVSFATQQPGMRAAFACLPVQSKRYRK